MSRIRSPRAMFMRATEIDPSFAAPYAWAAFTLMRVVTFGWNAALHGGGAEEAGQPAATTPAPAAGSGRRRSRQRRSSWCSII
ncbi:hypothetical protein KPL78_15420 [Roseomonas sp. HJA6]|uniref:CHAT domain-containing protein n=1 Tax=Roseomonas alba TaxID=2846776 RepID=A0ABS7AAD4_9PROT|nr:hypothetical protein [Neoroseomonas alba]MBW6399251.1 hypothetical protein [Neoroseomonas alba]